MLSLASQRAATSLCLPLLLAMLLWAYWPGAQGPQLLDDFSSLQPLENLRESPEQAADYILGEHSGPLGRSVSIATFVLEELLGDGSTRLSKLVNIWLHLLVTASVAVFFYLLLRPLAVPRAGLAAILFAGLWAQAPLQVSTVLYSVQRMAMLAALFSVWGLCAYLLWRQSLSAAQPRLIWLLLVPVFLVLGLLSKENAAVTVPLLLLTEICWLQACDRQGRVIPWLRRWSWGLVWAGGLLACCLLLLSWEWLAGRYGNREFTLQQRLLTQPGILWDYVRQFYWPEVMRLGIYHDDYPLSRSLGDPASTLTAIVAWLGALCAIVISWRWAMARRISYGVLFFLGAHSLESSVWPLELYFEHRNYLPGIGLVAVPLALYAALARSWRQLSAPLLAWVAVVLVVALAVTSSQVQIWSNRTLLAFQHLNGHPESARANREMASVYADAGEAAAALAYSRHAYAFALKHAAAGDEHPGDFLLRNVALACMAGQPLPQSEYSQLGRQQPGRPLGDVNTLSVIIRLRQAQTCPEFDWAGFNEHLASLYLQRFDTSLASANMFTGLAMLANAEAQWQYAHAYTARSLVLAPGRVRELLMQLHFAAALGYEAEFEELLAGLQARAASGELTRGQRDTLALYVKD